MCTDLDKQPCLGPHNGLNRAVFWRFIDHFYPIANASMSRLAARATLNNDRFACIYGRNTRTAPHRPSRSVFPVRFLIFCGRVQSVRGTVVDVGVQPFTWAYAGRHTHTRPHHGYFDSLKAIYRAAVNWRWRSVRSWSLMSVVGEWTMNASANVTTCASVQSGCSTCPHSCAVVVRWLHRLCAELM